MRKGELLSTLAEEMGLPKAKVSEFLDTLVSLAYKEAKSETGFTIPGLGKLVKKHRKARVGRNPQTGATLKIAAKDVLKFRLAKAAKVAVLGDQSKKKAAKKVIAKKGKKIIKKRK